GARGELEMRTLGETGQLREHFAGENVEPFLKDEKRRAAGYSIVKAMPGLFDHVANEDHRIDRLPGVFFAYGREDLAHLGRPRHTHDLAHGIGQLAGIDGPMARLAFLESAVINELDLEPADLAGLGEHLGL